MLGNGDTQQIESGGSRGDPTSGLQHSPIRCVFFARMNLSGAAETGLMHELCAVSDSAEHGVQGSGGALPRGPLPWSYSPVNVSLKCWGKVKC